MTALHQKYRPTNFSEVLGQAAAVKSLQQVVKDGRAKTFLFVGPSGIGKTTLARILVNSYCNGKETPFNKIEVDASKATADDLRSIVESSHYRAIGPSPVKVIIIDEAHKLSGNAWSVLLKPTEEPPAHVYWCLCTTDIGKVPKTILTRFLRYDLKPVVESEILDLLCKVDKEEKLAVNNDILSVIAEAASGSPRQALVYLEACAHVKTVAEAQAVMRTAGQSAEAVDLARFLLKTNGRTWAEAIKLLKKMEELEAESIRIVLVNYLASVLMNTKEDKRASQMLYLLSCFEKPYYTSDKFAPLLNSIGLALGLDK